MAYNRPILHYGHSESIDPVASFPLARQFFAIDSGPDVLVGMVASHHRLKPRLPKYMSRSQSVLVPYQLSASSYATDAIYTVDVQTAAILNVTANTTTILCTIHAHTPAFLPACLS